MPKVTPQRGRVVSPRHPPIQKDLWDRAGPISFDEGEGIKMALYGRPATGKTTLWATFPKPILAIICSGGKRPGELRSIDTPEYRQVVTQLKLETAAEILDITSDPRVGKFKTVVLDHGTGMQDMELAAILGVDNLPAQLSWGLASQQQYGQLANRCKEYMRSLLSLPQNVVIVAQEREFNTDSDMEMVAPSIGAAFTPSISGWLHTSVDYVCQTFLRPKEIWRTVTMKGKGGKLGKVLRTKVKTREVEYCLRTAPDPLYTTKFRVPRGLILPSLLVDANYDTIMDVIQGRWVPPDEAPATDVADETAEETTEEIDDQAE